MAARTDGPCIDDLPNEVLIRIFGFLNGTSIGRCASVCRRWRSTSTLILQCNAVWQLICVDEIDPEVLAELVGGEWRLGPGSATVDWLAVYKWWHCASNISRRKHSIQVFETVRENVITCMKISGSAIVTCHAAGTVALWNSEGFCRNLTIHQGPVTDVDFVNVAHKDGYADEYATYDHHHVATSSEDHSIRVSPLCQTPGFKTLKQYYGHSALQVRVSDNFMAVMLKMGGIHAYKIVYEGGAAEKLSLCPLWFRAHEGRLQKWIGFSSNALKVLGAGNEIDEIQLDTGAQSSRGVQFRASNGRPVADVLFPTHVIIQRGSTIIMNTASQCLCISVDSCSFVCYQTGLLIGDVMRVALHGALLAVALRHGRLNLYRVPSPAGLASLDFGAPCWSKKLSEEPLTSLAITHGAFGAPFVVASTSSAVYVLRWDC